MSDKTIRIVIADDHAVVRRGLCVLIETEPTLELVGEAADGIEAVELVRRLKPDVLVLDLLMPRQGGLETLAQINGAANTTRVLIVSSYAEDDQLFTAIQMGALGYLLKDSSPRELLQAIINVADGAPSLHPAVARRLMNEFHRPVPEAITERELEVLRLVAQGLSNQVIADRLVVSERTVRTHVGNILTKLHLASRTQAALFALRTGIAQLDNCPVREASLAV